MQRIITAFNQILTPLCKIQKSAWFDEEKEWKPSKCALETYRFVSEQRLLSVQPIKPEDIKELFPLSGRCANVNFFEEEKILYFPPLKKDAKFVPIFSLYCNLSKNQSVAKFRIMLVTLDESHQALDGIGFRMETPEGGSENANTNDNNSTGIHDFHHAQLIQQFSPEQFGNILPTKCPSWLPGSQPSFPMPADSTLR